MKILKPSTWPDWLAVLVITAAAAACGVLAAWALRAAVPGAPWPVSGAVAGAAPVATLFVLVYGDDALEWIIGTAGPWLRDNVLGRIR